MIYGTTSGGGTDNEGTLFRLNEDGTAFAKLHDSRTGVDGVRPSGGLVASDGILYGTVFLGRRFVLGATFGIRDDGTGLVILREGTPGEGAFPDGGLLLDSGSIFGATGAGGRFNGGTVYRLKLLPAPAGAASGVEKR